LTASLLYAVCVEGSSQGETWKGFEGWKRRRRDQRIPRIALQHPTQSSCSTLFYSGCDQTLISVTGINHEIFAYLEEKFTPWFNNYTPWTTGGTTTGIRRLAHDRSEEGGPRGRPRMLDARINLGLVLVWTRSRGAEKFMQMIFGLTGTPLAKWIRFGRRLLVKVLLNEPDAQIILPHPQDIELYKQAITRRHRHLHDAAFAADGVKLAIECVGDDPIVENRHFNRWTHDHYVTAIIVFAPDGTVPACVFDAPGSMHDSNIAEYGFLLYEKLELMWILYRAITVVDSAFPAGDKPYFIKSSAEEHARNAQELLVCADATSLRQTAEWGMNGFERSFPRLQDCLRWEEFGERKIIIRLVVLLYNLRARRVGINEILNTYMPNLTVEAQKYFGCTM